MREKQARRVGVKDGTGGGDRDTKRGVNRSVLTRPEAQQDPSTKAKARTRVMLPFQAGEQKAKL